MEITSAEVAQKHLKLTDDETANLINWGEKNLVLTFEDADTIQEESIERFRQLHIQAAGRETRSQETWQSQYEMVRNGEAFLIFGELEGELDEFILGGCKKSEFSLYKWLQKNEVKGVHTGHIKNFYVDVLDF